MLLAFGFCAWLRVAWPSALCAALSFPTLVLLSRHALTPSGRFGLANAVTSSRCVLVLGLTLPNARLADRNAVLLTLGVLLLDLIDGSLARARGDASAFGAHFDMETDALLVFLLTLRLWLEQRYGVWVLTAGLLRYAYVLSLWLSQGTGREAPRSLFGRLAFASSTLALLGGLWLNGVPGALCAAAGSAIVSFSFARSFYFSYVAS
jgi:phosphatidylglycerophosphate synthase